jgi:hypothetical protein
MRGFDRLPAAALLVCALGGVGLVVHGLVREETPVLGRAELPDAPPAHGTVPGVIRTLPGAPLRLSRPAAQRGASAHAPRIEPAAPRVSLATRARTEHIRSARILHVHRPATTVRAQAAPAPAPSAALVPAIAARVPAPTPAVTAPPSSTTGFVPSDPVPAPAAADPGPAGNGNGHAWGRGETDHGDTDRGDTNHGDGDHGDGGGHGDGGHGDQGNQHDG